MTYLPDKQTQVTGSPLQFQNCVAATGTMLIDRATVGRLRIGPDTIRAATGDKVGGLRYSQLADAAIKVTDGEVMLDVRRLDNRGQLRDLVASGRGVGFIGSAAVTRPTSRRTNSFTGIHSWMIGALVHVPAGGCQCEAKIATQHDEFAVEDPGTTLAGWLRWSAGLVYRTAEAAGDIWTISTRDTEGVKRVAIGPGHVRATPSTDAKPLRAIVVGRTYSVVETVRGGRWSRGGGKGYAYGWHRVAAGGFIRGGALR